MRKLSGDISRIKKLRKYKNILFHDEYFSVWDKLFTIVLVFRSIQWYAAVAEFLFTFAFIDKTMQRLHNYQVAKEPNAW